MANYTFMQITAFGTDEELMNFDKNPPRFKGPKIEIIIEEKSRIIRSEFKSQAAIEVLYGLAGQMPDLSLLVDLEIEPAYLEISYRKNYQQEFKTLLEIPDFRDEEFFEKIDKKYLDQFDQIDLNQNLINLIENLPTGKLYLNLLKKHKIV